MANRSLFPNGVDVIGEHLQKESYERSQESKFLSSSLAKFGVIQGLNVTVNTVDNTKIDVGPGFGICPRGDRVQVISTQLALSITNTSGTKNYVLLVYDEALSGFEAHESDGSVRPTRATESSRVVILTEAQYNALPNVDQDLSRNDKSRALILAVVTGTGGPLSSANIQRPTVFNTVFTASGLSLPGVEVLQIGNTNTVGAATIIYQIGPQRLSYKAPADSSPGSAVTITGSGAYLLTSSGGATILVSVTFPQLPLVGSTNVFNINELYNQLVPRNSAVDAHHRSMIGGGIPSQNNPHGMTLDDLAPGVAGTLEQHQDVMHSNGIVKGSSPTFLSTTIDTSTAPDRVLIGVASPGDAIYINGRRIQGIVGSNIITFTDGTPEPGLYGIYMSQDGVLFKHQVARFTVPTPPLAPHVQLADVLGDLPITTIPIDVATSLLRMRIGVAPEAYVRLLTSSIERIKLHLWDTTSGFEVHYNSTGITTALSSNIQTFAPPDPDQNYLISYVWWSGSASGFLGLGYGTGNSPNLFVDKRTYGTLDELVTTTSDIQSTVKQNRSHGLHGLVFKKNYYTDLAETGPSYETYDLTTIQAGHLVTNILGLNFDYVGGDVYIDGVLYSIPGTTFTLPPSSNVRVYLTKDGVFYSTSFWETIESGFARYSVVRAYEITTGPSSITSVVFAGKWIDCSKDAPGGIVSRDPIGKVNIREYPLPSYLTSYSTQTYLVNAETISSTPLAGSIRSSSEKVALRAIKVGTSTGQAIHASSTGQSILSQGQSVFPTTIAHDFTDSGSGINARFISTNPSFATLVADASASGGLGIFINANSASNQALYVSQLGSSNAIIAGSIGSDATIETLNAGTGPAFRSTGGNVVIPSVNSYRYDTVRTRRKHVSAASFMGDEDAFTSSRFAPIYWFDSPAGSGGIIVGQVEIPAGALITNIGVMRQTGAAPTASCTLTLTRLRADGVVDVLFSDTSIWSHSPSVSYLNLGAVSAYTPTLGLTSPLSDSGSYRIYLKFPSSGTSDIYFYAAVVDFTYTEVSGLEL